MADVTDPVVPPVESMDVDSSCSIDEISAGDSLGGNHEIANHNSSLDITSSNTMTKNGLKVQPKRNRLNITVYIPKERTTPDGTVPDHHLPYLDGNKQLPTRSTIFESHEQKPISGPKRTIPKSSPSASKSDVSGRRGMGMTSSNTMTTNALKVQSKPDRSNMSVYIPKERTTPDGTVTDHHLPYLNGNNQLPARSTIFESREQKPISGPKRTIPKSSSSASKTEVSGRRHIGEPSVDEENYFEIATNIGTTVESKSKCPLLSSSPEPILPDDCLPEKSEVIADDVFYDLDEDTGTQDCDSSSDIEEIICGLKEFKRRKWTPSSSSSHRLFVGSSGSWYEGDFDGRTISGLGTLYSSDKRQFIQGTWLYNTLDKILSCQFTDQGSDEWAIYLRKQANSYLLTFDGDQFVARAELCTSNFVDLNLPFRSIKLDFFRNLVITKVIEDRVQSTRESALNGFEKALKTAVNDAANPIHFAATLITLRKYLRNNPTKVILTSMIKNKNIPAALRDAANSLLVSENQLSNRRLELLKFSRDTLPPKLEVLSVIWAIYNDAVNHHRQALVDKCPSFLPCLITNIWDLPAAKIIYVSKTDIELFHHLATMTKDHHLLSFFNELHFGLFEKLRNIDGSSLPNVVMPLSTPVYGFLFKSFLEIVSEISLRAENCSVPTMFVHENNKWKLVDKIIWKQDAKQSNKTSLTQQSLECQYRFIFRLLRHCEPKNYHPDKNFDYEYKVLNREDSDDSWFKKQCKKLKKLINVKNNLIDIPQDRQIWLYILDYTIYKVIMQVASYSTACLEVFRPVLDGYVKFVSGCPTNSYESFRVVTHNILMFTVQAVPNFHETEKLSEKDLIILEKQMKYITEVSANMESAASASSDFRNLIDEYSRYWTLRHLVTVDDSLYPAYLVSQIQRIHEELLRLVEASLDKTVNVSSLVKYFRVLNDFIEDFKDIDFPSNWYVKSDSNRTGIIEKVDNKITSETRCSYKVIDLKLFVELFEDGCQPQHHVIQIVRRLLECAIDSLTINWISTSEQSVAQLEGTGVLLCAIRSSFLYLKEQPDYRDFELFTNESVQPFLQVVSKCHVLEEFKVRVNVVKESFWYIRKMDEIGIVQALELFNKINHGSLNSENLKQCYDGYLLEYNEYIGQAKSKSAHDGVAFVVKSLKKNNVDFKELSEWDEEFKTEQLPKILAGLSAVWSLLVSKDVSSSGKFLKPHCIQILCVMRLLSLDKFSQGVEHHLAQVLTGQGKSVILGLLAAILAFTGYKVRVICYSEYLATRDKDDFGAFFNTLGLSKHISYGTFKEMANEFLNPVFQGKKVCLGDLVRSIVLEHGTLETLGSPSSDVNKTVLLIDEVDVFFSEHYYGNTYNSCALCEIPGLPQIQEKIWETASGSNLGQNALYIIIQQFIDDGVNSRTQELVEYNKFRLTPGKYLLLDRDLIANEFTNRSLLEKHLMVMVEIALEVSKWPELFKDSYKIIDGEICRLRPEDGIYSPSQFLSYYNVFNYFRLKEDEFDHRNFSNYGYILLQTGHISYAKLPEEFPLILGVSGTVSNLSDHENEAIKSYNINSFSILPSFFGDSNLEFNKFDHFCILHSEKDWSSKIFERINKLLQRHRAVLVFFNTDVNLAGFKQDYGNKFDRLNVLTINTDEHLKSKYIDEAGIPNAVTLCTREMGRGVDFKSSMAVEKRGGVHVIQTFFSPNVREETQAKGRTARKDNKGSYELILCEEHLIAVKLLTGTESDTYDYSSLHQTRLNLMEIEGQKNAEKIRKSDESHKLTMEFYGIGASREK